METSEELLYKKLKDILAEKIFLGEFADGDLLPTERDLAAQYGMSRVTVRKALESMAQDKIITREQGRGTIYREKLRGFTGSMEIIALVAPTHDPFFSSFIRQFEALTERAGSVVVFKQADHDAHRKIESTLFKLYRKEIRHIVIWPYGNPIDSTCIQRLRGLGTNLVFFDQVIDSPAADSVSVDNAHAIQSLYEYLVSAQCKRIGFIGWELNSGSSTQAREHAFSRLKKEQDTIERLPWREERGLENDLAGLIKTGSANSSLPDGFLCGNGNIGIALKKLLLNLGLDKIKVCCVDDLPGAAELKLTAYAQPMEQMAQKVYEQLLVQNKKGERWKAGAYSLKGTLIVRE